MVKDLRDKTGAGMMDCKKALAETDGDMEAAIDWLRKKGMSKAAKKAGRVAAEGLVGVAVGGDAGALVEVNAETDFVARNDQFKDFVKSAAQIALDEGGDVEKLLAPSRWAERRVQQTPDRADRQDRREHERAPRRRAVGDRRAWWRPMSTTPPSPELGKIGVLVALKSTADKAKLAALGKQLAMHVAAAAPLALTAEHLSKEVVERERAIQTELARAVRQAGKRHREDDRRPHAQVLRGDGAAVSRPSSSTARPRSTR